MGSKLSTTTPRENSGARWGRWWFQCCAYSPEDDALLPEPQEEEEEEENSTTITTAPIELLDSEPQDLDDDVQIINSQDKSVTLDDDSDVIIEESNQVTIDIDSDDLEIIETNNTPIVIEDENPNCVINPLNVIRKKQDQLFDIVCQENSLLAQIIEDAINLDVLGSMKRIIHRTLIPLYLNCSKSYKESETFKSALKRTSILLETAPHLKYSHIKSLCESLKYTIKIKRNARLEKKQTQLQTNGSSPKKRKHKRTKFTRRKKRKKEITNADQTRLKKTKDCTGSANSKGNNTESSTTIEIEVPAITSISPTSNKENIVTDNIQTNERLNNMCNDIALIDTTNNTDLENNLLTPRYVISTLITPPDTHTGQTIESLEKQISCLKMELEKIEEEEVTNDTMLSPYLVAETLKSKIVKLYKQLCDVTGSEPTKRHEVKLQVVNGHPPGPARCLEEYINDNIDEYGNLPFPDIFEVVRCVKRAVEEDCLNWNRKQIVAEAQVLLKHYGHAIQKRRKKREWRDMVSRCKEELVDPADLDPVLEAKLLENSRIAKRNEDEILDRYARLEKENSSNPAFRLSLETGGDSETDTDEDAHEPSHSNNNKSIENNTQDAPSLTMADSTTNLDNLQGPVINSDNIHGNTGIINSSINAAESVKATNAICTSSVLEINPIGCSGKVNSINVVKTNLQNGSNVIDGNNVTETNQNVSNFINPTTSLPSNIQNCPILIVNSNNLLPNLHGSICYINSRPVLATRIQSYPRFINSTDNLEGNLQNGPNSLAGNLQNGPNFINNLTGNIQNGPSFIKALNNLAGNLQNEVNFINPSNNLESNQQNRLSIRDTLNNLAGNLQSLPNIIKTPNGLAGNLQHELNFINSSNNLAGNLQNGPSIINNLVGNLQNGLNFINSTNNFEGNLESRPSIINSSNNLEANLQNGPNFINSSDNLEGNLKNKPNNKEDNLHSCAIDSTTDKEIETTVIGNVEYNRTIMMDSNGSDTDNERQGQTDIDNVKERDKSETEEIDYKIKIKQEQEDVIKLLSELGSDCVGTVFDIEDPFLVIEISDSSDEE